ncbi:methionine-rich copper-binding protein CopC [Kribbella sp. VKM Ac-2571]|uniref:copper resistance CopC family protein n=1 Tax=Kribbella sp. VKM Ac-2571 TaxID=2512222 RepID=UPI00105F96E9|nr:copper resistance CopC family protein [Kribbella sp. VKM Ac-2571]TDO68600.1 methionine-rich copper-binding protein CopC [Kribbella sp. VKM Ac-2571]
MLKPSSTSWLRTLRRSCPPILATLAITSALTVAPAVRASAHTKLTASTPANGARLSTSPAHVSFSFDQSLQPVQAWDAVLVTGPDGFHHPAMSLRVAGDTVHATCDRLGKAGTYQISYRVISGDGHPIVGHITVTLDRPDIGTPVAATMGLPSVGVPAWAWILELAIAAFLLHGYRRWRSELGSAPVLVQTVPRD